VLSIDDVRRVPSKLRPRVSVSNVMAPIERLPRVEGDRPASSVLDELADDRVVLVTDHGHPVGMVTLEGLVKQLDRNEQMERVLGAVR
jgi:predicted transcriptional regulator